MSTEPAIDNAATAGELLCRARQARNLTLQQVATQLNLKVSQIEQLENDQFEGNMLEIFARGYIRAYAKLLKISDSAVLLAFNRQMGSKGTIAKPMRTFSNRAAKQTTENRYVWLTYAIVALMLILLFVWWRQSAWLPMQTADVAGQAEASNTAQQMTVAAGAADGAELVDNALDKQASIETLAPATPEQLDQMLNELMPQQQTDSAQIETQTVLADDSLSMRFKENCWVNVTDAEGNRIAFGTKQAGYTMELSGKSPFVVTLGNPSVVTILYNQQPFDISTLPGGRVAKFTIPGSE